MKKETFQHFIVYFNWDLCKICIPSKQNILEKRLNYSLISKKVGTLFFGNVKMQIKAECNDSQII